MNNLLNANFVRIFKSRLFYIGLFFAAAFGFFSVITFGDEDFGTEFLPSIPLALLPMLIAAFVGVIMAPEFSQGPMRNKIIVGHKHRDIYLAALISFSGISLIYYIICEIFAIGFGMALLESFEVSWKAATVTLLVMAALMISSTAVSVMICMVVTGEKSVALVLVLQYAFMFLGIMNEFVPDVKALQTVAKFIPQGYYGKLNVLTMPDKPWEAVLCAIVMVVVFTWFGIHTFKKNDMK